MRCISPKRIVGVLVAGVAVFVLVPGAGRSLASLLIVAACPLSMLGMMAVIGRAATKLGRGTRMPHRPNATETSEAELAELRAQLARVEGTDTTASEP